MDGLYREEEDRESSRACISSFCPVSHSSSAHPSRTDDKREVVLVFSSSFLLSFAGWLCMELERGRREENNKPLLSLCPDGR